jgi:phosphatidylserine/phosphatidylglycerophosphate/cardiolipin synthase-like enzyme
VITGSFNFTKAAEENNAENLLIIHDKKLASLYIKNW